MLQHQQIDRYIIRRVLGSGAMGIVYAAWDPKLCREIAIKLLSARLLGDNKARERFQREAHAIAALRHHNIVEIYDYSGIDSEYLYLVMEKLDGEDLYSMLSKRGLIPEVIAAAIGYELCSALEKAHEAGIVHRDLKPENIFITNYGRVVLTDFGVVKAIGSTSVIDGYQEETDIIGTPGFMAPELMAGKHFGASVDIYALGALLYNITTNQMPFSGATPSVIYDAAIAGSYEDPRKHNIALSKEFCEAIESCLHPNPKKRIQTARDLRHALQVILRRYYIDDIRDDIHAYVKNGPAYTQQLAKRMQASMPRTQRYTKTLVTKIRRPHQQQSHRYMIFITVLLVVCSSFLLIDHMRNSTAIQQASLVPPKAKSVSVQQPVSSQNHRKHLLHKYHAKKPIRHR